MKAQTLTWTSLSECGVDWPWPVGDTLALPAPLPLGLGTKTSPGLGRTDSQFPCASDRKYPFPKLPSAGPQLCSTDAGIPGGRAFKAPAAGPAYETGRGQGLHAPRWELGMVPSTLRLSLVLGAFGLCGHTRGPHCRSEHRRKPEVTQMGCVSWTPPTAAARSAQPLVLRQGWSWGASV